MTFFKKQTRDPEINKTRSIRWTTIVFYPCELPDLKLVGEQWSSAKICLNWPVFLNQIHRNSFVLNHTSDVSSQFHQLNIDFFHWVPLSFISHRLTVKPRQYFLRESCCWKTVQWLSVSCFYLNSISTCLYTLNISIVLTKLQIQQLIRTVCSKELIWFGIVSITDSQPKKILIKQESRTVSRRSDRSSVRAA